MTRYEDLLQVGEEIGKEFSTNGRRLIVDLGTFDLDAYASGRFVADTLTAAGVPEDRVELVYKGPVSHPSSRLAVKWHRGRPLKDSEKYYKSGNPGDAYLFLVDQSGPQSPFVADESSPYWRQVIGVIDDHDLHRELPIAPRFTDRRNDYNAASGICVGYLQQGLVLTDGLLPTYLLAGIHTDTNGLRRAKPLDREASNYLLSQSVIDSNVLQTLSEPKLPIHWKEKIRAAEKSFKRTNGYGFANVGTIHAGDRDVIGVTADKLLEKQGLTMVAVAGYVLELGRVHCSLRSITDIPYPILSHLFPSQDNHVVGGRPTAGVIIQHTPLDGEADVVQSSLDDWMDNVREQFNYLKTHAGAFE